VVHVASALNVSEEKAKYHLHEMSKRHLISWVGNMDASIPSQYMLEHEGRRVLVEKGLL
jgi:hypothetical protein